MREGGGRQYLYPSTFLSPLGFTGVSFFVVSLETELSSGIQRRASRVSKRCDRATVWSRKNFQRLRKIWVFERKHAQCNMSGVRCHMSGVRCHMSGATCHVPGVMFLEL